jgi:hypothetical protein
MPDCCVVLPAGRVDELKKLFLVVDTIVEQLLRLLFNRMYGFQFSYLFLEPNPESYLRSRAEGLC